MSFSNGDLDINKGITVSSGCNSYTCKFRRKHFSKSGISANSTVFYPKILPTSATGLLSPELNFDDKPNTEKNNDHLYTVCY